jgi:hypothetical protein
MNKLISTASLVIAMSFISPLAYSHAEHGQPQYGGIVAEAGEAQFELVAKEGKFIVYLSNHGQPLASQGASGKLTLLDGAKKTELELKAAGDNRLEAVGSAASGAKALISVQWADKKPLQARAVLK